jgi:hypothetical protein
VLAPRFRQTVTQRTRQPHADRRLEAVSDGLTHVSRCRRMIGQTCGGITMSRTPASDVGGPAIPFDVFQ